MLFEKNERFQKNMEHAGITQDFLKDALAVAMSIAAELLKEKEFKEFVDGV